MKRKIRSLGKPIISSKRTNKKPKSSDTSAKTQPKTNPLAETKNLLKTEELDIAQFNTYYAKFLREYDELKTLSVLNKPTYTMGDIRTKCPYIISQINEYYKVLNLETKTLANSDSSPILTNVLITTFDDIKKRLEEKIDLDEGRGVRYDYYLDEGWTQYTFHFVSVKMKNFAVGGICYTLKHPYLQMYERNKQCYFVGIHKLPSFLIFQKIIGYSPMFTSYVDLILTHLKKNMKPYCKTLRVQPIGIMAKKLLQKGFKTTEELSATSGGILEWTYDPEAKTNLGTTHSN